MFLEMKLAFFLFLVFILVPVAEIATFIQVGSVIGVPMTLAGIVLTALIGAFLVRRQGFKVLADAQTSMQQNTLPVEQIIHGAFILLAGLLLITPGFITDLAGFILLIPPLRMPIAHAVWRWLKKNSEIHIVRSGPGPASGKATIIDEEAVEIDEEAGRISGPSSSSPWKNGSK